MSTRCWYFAYGSNMQVATFRGRRGIAYTAAVAARLVGWRLVLDKPLLVPTGNSVANVVPDPGGAVLGVAYDITGDDMAHVDLTEGVLIGNYARVAVTVETLADPPSPLPAYTLTSERRDPGLRPSPRYMGLLVDGAREHGLPDDWIATLAAVPTVEESAVSRAFRAVVDEVLRRR